MARTSNVKPDNKTHKGKGIRRTQAARSGPSRRTLAELFIQRPAKGLSTKELHANLARLRRYLGVPCPHFGKRGVVHLAGPSSSTSSSSASAASTAPGAIGNTEAPARFNKYAGWVEWKNAVLLWVNAAGGSFGNSFKRGGRQINWYVGGAKPSEQSPIVKRLLGFGSGDHSAKQTRVLLFMRPCATEPYVNCGECRYVAHDSTKKGFEFTWELADFESLRGTAVFKSLRSSADGSVSPAQKLAERWA
eukprot:TRINITY_DN50946_c0_g1_i1.p1 TRINITY_DN50946_c0_g1~~TRINITY_DN50946_c0_g1_i1.p1  ORF type:complete len:248 (-),score=21.79 TRINITY_DN50946_c0_g1_i1:63-806(-)